MSLARRHNKVTGVCETCKTQHCDMSVFNRWRRHEVTHRRQSPNGGQLAFGGFSRMLGHSKASSLERRQHQIKSTLKNEVANPTFKGLFTGEPTLAPQTKRRSKYLRRVLHAVHLKSPEL